jgi:putative tricarboxylic transport membrane protein
MVLVAVALYVLLSERLGFLLVAPVCLVLLFRTFGQRWGPAFIWAVSGTLVVHLAFYKLLRVPLPWGVLKPFY